MANKKQRQTYCRNGCGLLIHFDNEFRSEKSGKMIPLEEDGEPHNCAMSEFKRKPVLCKHGCGTELFFHPDEVSENDKMIPLESNGNHHECPNNPYNKGKKK